MKPNQDPWSAESKKAASSQKELNKAVDDITKIIMHLFSVKEFRVLSLLLILSVFITGIVYVVIFSISYWQVSVPAFALLAWRIYSIIKTNFKKK